MGLYILRGLIKEFTLYVMWFYLVHWTAGIKWMQSCVGVNAEAPGYGSW